MFDKKAKDLLAALIKRNAQDISKEYNQEGMSWEEKRLLKKAIKDKEDAKEKKEENKRPRT